MSSPSSSFDLEAFQDRLLEGILKIWPLLLSAILVFGGGYGAWVGWNYYELRQELAVENSLAPLKKVIDQYQEKSQEALFASLRADKDSSEKPLSFDSIRSEAEKLHQLILANPQRVSSQAAALQLTEVYVEAGQKTQAQELLEKVLASSQKDFFLKGLLQLQLATLLSFADPQQSLAMLDLIQEAPGLKPFKALVLYKKNLILEEKGDLEQAKKNLEMIVAEHSDSSLAELAKGRLKFLAVQKFLVPSSEGAQN